MDMAISKDGTRMVTITYEKNIGIYDLINLKPFYSWYGTFHSALMCQDILTA
jgi:hypothetical protein